MRFMADAIRAVLVGKIVLPDPEAGLAFFTIKAARRWFPADAIQQSQILAAATARKPLGALGITATTQAGFHANQHQEIRWEWDVEHIGRRLERRKTHIQAAMNVMQRHV